VLTQQLQEPITESAQEDKYIHSKENTTTNNNNNKLPLFKYMVQTFQDQSGILQPKKILDDMEPESSSRNH
jgi:hypothetical protein